MADFTALKTAIQNAIKQNGNEEITGTILQEVMLAVVSTLGDSAINDLVTELSAEVTNRQNADNTLQTNINDEATARSNADTALQNAINTINTKLAEGYLYVGIATTSTNPSTPSGKVFYIAVAAGTYTNFLNSSSQPLVLTQGINILKFNGTSWSVEQVWGVDDEPTAGSENFVKSGGVKSYIDKIGLITDKIECKYSGLFYSDKVYAYPAFGGGYNGYVIYAPNGVTIVNYSGISLVDIEQPHLFANYPQINEVSDIRCTVDDTAHTITLPSNTDGCYILISVKLSLQTQELATFWAEKFLTKQDGEALQEEIDNIKLRLTKIVSFDDAINGYFIVAADGSLSYNTDYAYLTDIHVTKGSVIKLRATGYAQNVTMIGVKIDATHFTPKVISIDTSNREYEWVADQDCIIGVSYKIADTHNLKITANIAEEISDIQDKLDLKQEVSFDAAIDGYFIDYGGSLSNNEDYAYLTDIKVLKGETITLVATGYAQNVTMIGVKESSTHYIPKVISIDYTNRVYSWTADEDCIIGVSYKKSNTHTLNISSGLINLRSNVLELNDEIQEEIESINAMGSDLRKEMLSFANLFPRIAVIGDSLASGQLEDPSGQVVSFGDIYGESWLSNIARIINADARTHYSEAGLTCRGWLHLHEEPWGWPSTNYLEKMQSDAIFNAYFIALGTNDIARSALDPASEYYYPLGNITDIAGTNSFIGYYKQIIEAVRAKAPHCAIFCLSMYKKNTPTDVNYSNAVQQMCQLYDNTFYVDFANNSDVLQQGSIGTIGFHFSTWGYAYIANVIWKLVNKICMDNPMFFQIWGEYNSVGTKYED